MVLLSVEAKAGFFSPVDYGAVLLVGKSSSFLHRNWKDLSFVFFRPSKFACSIFCSSAFPPVVFSRARKKAESQTAEHRVRRSECSIYHLKDGALVCIEYDTLKYGRMTWPRIVLSIVLILVVVVVGFAYRYITAGKAELEYLEEAVRVPVGELGLSTPEEDFSLGDLKGQAVLVDVWASWCAPCVAAMPSLVQLQKSYGADLQLVGLNVDEGGWEVVQAFLARHPEVNFRIVRGLNRSRPCCFQLWSIWNPWVGSVPCPRPFWSIERGAW